MSEDLPKHDASVFLSYSSKDVSRVAAIAKFLDQSGVSLWQDKDKILGGQLYAEQIAHAIAHSKVVLLLCSADSLSSDNVVKEIFLTWDYFHRNIIPVWLDKPIPIPTRLQYPLAGSHWIETSGLSTDEYGPKLLSAIRKFDVAPVLPAISPLKVSNQADQRTSLRLKKGDRPIPSIDWELVELLGKGGFGEVWKAINPLLPTQKTSRLKILPGLAGNSPEILRHEAEMILRAQATVGEMGIVPLQHAYLSCNPPCLQYPYISGGTLTDIIEEMHTVANPLSQIQIISIIHRIATTVGAFHRAIPSLTHCDLKPSNILVQRNGRRMSLRINDFGIGRLAVMDLAKMDSRSRSMEANMSAALTGAHTPLYASPQLLNGENPNPTDDIYAIGVMWYQMIHGRATLGAPSGRRWYEELKEKRLPTQAIDLLASCLEPDPTHRPLDGQFLAAQLQEIIKTQLPASQEIVTQELRPLPIQPAKKLDEIRKAKIVVPLVPPAEPLRATIQAKSIEEPRLALPKAREESTVPVKKASSSKSPTGLIFFFVLLPILAIAELGGWTYLVDYAQSAHESNWIARGDWREMYYLLPVMAFSYLFAVVRAWQFVNPDLPWYQSMSSRTIQWGTQFLFHLACGHFFAGTFYSAVSKLKDEFSWTNQWLEMAFACLGFVFMVVFAVGRILIRREKIRKSNDDEMRNSYLGMILAGLIFLVFGILLLYGGYAYFHFTTPYVLPELDTPTGKISILVGLILAIAILSILYFGFDGFDHELNYLLYGWMAVIAGAIATSLPTGAWSLERFSMPNRCRSRKERTTLKSSARRMAVPSDVIATNRSNHPSESGTKWIAIIEFDRQANSNHLRLSRTNHGIYFQHRRTTSDRRG